MSKGRDHKPHIGIFGRRNNGKSSLINAITGQDVAIISDIAGTTTDPVRRSYEIEGIGPAVIIDTAGIDDTGDLGRQRVRKSQAIIRQVDLAILVVAGNEFSGFEKELISQFEQNDLPFILLYNKTDLQPPTDEFRDKIREQTHQELFEYSAISPEKYNPGLLKRLRESMPRSAYQQKGLIGDLLEYGDIVLLITPVDTEAPDGRLILPQVQVIRDILDNDCTAIVLKEREVDAFKENKDKT